MSGRIALREGDITEERTDAIVNAANSALRLGAGVAGAIRSKGGPSIQEECDAIGPVAVGDAAITGAGDLPTRYVIHAAGMPLGGGATDDSVRSAMRKSLELAKQRGLETLAVPAIGAGIGGVSMRRCAEILLEEARAHVAGETTLREIRFVLFGEQAYRLFESVRDAHAIDEQMRKLRRP